MKNLGYYNGKKGPIEQMSVPMTDRAFYFGDGVYDAVMCRNNIPYLLFEHIERFFKNCERLAIIPPITKTGLFELIYELVPEVDASEKFVYFHASRGSALREHSTPCKKGNLCIMIMPRSVGDLKEKMSAKIVPDNRYSLCDIKTLNLLPNVLAARDADEVGADEAIFCREGIITEGSHSNVFIIKGGRLITAPKSHYILPGVTREHLIQRAHREGIMVEEREYGENELMSADEILITSSSKLVRGVKMINGKEVGGKAQRLLEFLQNGALRAYFDATITNA